MRVILVVLALIWVLALTPTLLRKLRERESTYSVVKFHRSLRVMRQAAPGQAAEIAAYAASPPVWTASGRPLPASRPVGAPRSVGAAAGSGSSAARRRRQVLTVLAGGLGGTFLLGLVPGLGLFWDISLLLLAATAVYVGLLIHFRRTALERADKVVYLGRNIPSPAVPATSIADQVTAEVPAVPVAAAFGPRHASRVRTSGPVRIIPTRREARTPAVVGG